MLIVGWVFCSFGGIVALDVFGVLGFRCLSEKFGQAWLFTGT